MAANLTFDEIVGQIRGIVTRAQILVEEVPAPQKLAPYAFAMTADVTTLDAIDNDDCDDEDLAKMHHIISILIFNAKKLNRFCSNWPT